MLVETAYRKYSPQMLQSMTRFSRDETTAKDAVSQAITQAIVSVAAMDLSCFPARPRARFPKKQKPSTALLWTWTVFSK